MTATFTAWNDPAVDRFVQGQIDFIVRAVSELMGPDLRALLLCGGFGRGEGSVRIAPDGTMGVVNDYDIEVVYNDRWGELPSKIATHLRYRSQLERLAMSLAGQLRLKQVDLTLRGFRSYGAIRVPRLADYDLRFGSRLLFGRNDPRRAMRDYAPQDIPAFEGTWLLRNRGIGLLLAALYLSENGDLPDSNRENFYIEINKAALAMGDALYILHRRYTCSYAARAAGVDALPLKDFARGAELLELYRLAAEYKLRPRDDMYPGRAPRDLWFTINQLYGEFFLHHESRRLEHAFKDFTDYARWVVTQPRPGSEGKLRLLFEQMTGHVGHSRPGMRFLKQDRYRNVLFTLLLLATWTERGVDARHAGPALEIIGDDVASLSPAGWRGLAREFLLLIHPGGEVGRFLGLQR